MSVTDTDLELTTLFGQAEQDSAIAGSEVYRGNIPAALERIQWAMESLQKAKSILTKED